MTQRTERVGEALRRAVQGVISRGLADPRLQNVMVTVSEAHVTTDLHNATLLVVVTPEAKESLAMHALKDAAGHIRHHAAEQMLLPRMPELCFKVDKGQKKQAGVLEALRLVERERAARSAGTGGTGGTAATPGGAGDTSMNQPTERSK